MAYQRRTALEEVERGQAHIRCQHNVPRMDKPTSLRRRSSTSYDVARRICAIFGSVMPYCCIENTCIVEVQGCALFTPCMALLVVEGLSSTASVCLCSVVISFPDIYSNIISPRNFKLSIHYSRQGEQNPF